MMQLVPGDHPGERAHRDFVLIRHAAPHPRVILKLTEQQHCGPPYGLELLDQTGQRTLVERAVANVIVLLEAFDGSPVVAGNS